MMDKKIERKMSVAEMRMLRWNSGVTSEYIRESIGVALIMDKMRENRLK